MACRGARLLSMLLPLCLTLRPEEQRDLDATPNLSALPGAQNVKKKVDSPFCQAQEQCKPDPGLVCTLGGGGARALVVDVGIFKGLRSSPAWPKKVLAISGAAWFATIFTYAKDEDGNFIGFDLLGELGESDFCGMKGKTPEQPLAFHECNDLLSALHSTDYAAQGHPTSILDPSQTRSEWASNVHTTFFEKFGIEAETFNDKHPHVPDMYVLVASLYENTNLGSWKQSSSIQAHGFDAIVGDGSNDMCVWQTRDMLWPSELQSMNEIMKKAAPAIGSYVGVAESAALSSYFSMSDGGWMKGGYFLSGSMLDTPCGELSEDHLPMSYYTMSDSGNVESTGVPTALAMGHNQIFSVLNGGGNVNPERALQCSEENLLRCYSEWIGLELLALFFEHDKSWVGESAQLRHYNHVFDGAAFPELLRSLQDSIKGGNGAVATISVNTKENTHFHIEAGREVTITFVVMLTGISGEAALPRMWLSEPNTAQQLEAVRTAAVARSWESVTALVDAIKKAEVNESFRWGPQIHEVHMTEPVLVCAWLFSEMVAWVTKQAAMRF